MSSKYHAPTARPWAGSPYRRRRTFLPLVLLALAGALYVWLYGAPAFLSLSPSLKDIGFGFAPPSSSRAGRVAQAKPQLAGEGAHADVREIDALLHFLVAHPERRLDEDTGTIRVEGLGSVAVDGTQPVDLRVYAPDGDYDWAEHVKRVKEQYPLVVFSKTYCPYSIRAKALLASYTLVPAPKIVEINVRSDGPQIQSILARLTGRSTVPNILLQGTSIGGSDDVHRLHDEHTLVKTLEEGGVEVKGEPKTTQPQRRSYHNA
ncbi:Glutaredoxin-C2 [Trametes pubescens]|uniref:Glutaredoxin-C2 n=1 Tax=Trametes pubescens TaxID=154538 RepID=A0A1M2W660_TRAPU|nr:Glutaredoxin-C2 [Trametes pubescens]OJT15285.1 Glutaredoxin-C2 [Trametes pubescens]OJT15287.1 Glutaredoxin-C2 [Trametes pubescens]OJT15306.1 Glutaredoxin-C2 [Trametes pubescens]